ncbi:MAG: hypothetical protein H7A25_07305 [Leptospiraceae bacterium]|nr:hypothetical protein [Leptospiraceae bacterium]MCP5499691.1 hypothetical protein [Leptospiraceae bacterium]
MTSSRTSSNQVNENAGKPEDYSILPAWGEKEISELKLNHCLINLSHKVNDLQEIIYRLNKTIQNPPFEKRVRVKEAG